MRMLPRRSLVLVPLGALMACLSSLAAGQVPPPTPLIYSSAPAAQAIHSGTATLPGIPEALRQSPIRDAWPAQQVLSKLSGPDLARMSADGMVSALRAGLAATPGGVGVDELRPNHWTVSANRNLAAALSRLGPAAARVVLYISPAFVSRIGSTDVSRPLSAQNATLVAALRLTGVAMLEMYHGDPQATPLRADEAAAYPTRWLARFPGALESRLRVMLAPPRHLTQASMWAQIRATPAGRELLDNGPAAYGLQEAPDGLAWLEQYRLFTAQPDRSVSGTDARVPQLGGLRITQVAPRQLRLTATLRARIVVRLVRPGYRRSIGSFRGPLDARITVPPLPRLTAGRYQVLVTAVGERLNERATAQITLGPLPS